MNAKLLLPISLLLLACQSKTTDNNSNNSQVKNQYSFDFLVGNWKRTNEKVGKVTYEKWIKKNDSTYIGKTYTIAGKDTIFAENTILSPINSKWFIQIQNEGESLSTNFELMEIGQDSFTCENLNNNFPTIIKYERNNDILEAEISNDEMSIPFYFTSL